VRVIAGAQAHVTVQVACRMLGLGAERVRRVRTDDQGRMLTGALRAEPAEYDGPTIVSAQPGCRTTAASRRWPTPRRTGPL
jgi:glutamate/tyrosine decarboxylase-like PLP-dependent enzyme